MTASPRSWTPDSSLRARKISVDIFFKRRRYFLSQFLSSFTRSPPSRSLTQFSSSQIFQESNHEAENLFSKDQWIWRKKEKATREFLTRRLILSSIERKKKKNDQSRTRLPIFNGISLRSPRVTKRFFNFTGTKVITVARETIITPSFSLSPSLIVLVEPCNFLFAHAVIFHDQMPPSINVITRVFICPTRARFTGYSGLKIAGIRR